MPAIVPAKSPHVCVLDSFQYGGKGCRCGRWYIELRGQFLTVAFVSLALRNRASEYSYAIRSGQFEDMRAAVKDHTAHALRERAAENLKIRRRWELRQRNAYPRFIRAAAQILLTPDARCTYCGGPAQTLDHVLPQGRWPDLAQRLSNLTPACKSCNSQKNCRTVDEWKASRLAKGLPWPPLVTQNQVDRVSDLLV